VPWDHVAVESVSPVEYVVYGAGAIGGVVGGRLFQAGRAVTLIARGSHLEALRSGLRIESPLGTDVVTVPSVEHPRSISWGPDHVVLLAVKSQQTPAVLAELAAAAPRETPVVCLQNGVANEPAALRLFPHVYGVCVMCPASHLEPGVVQAWSAPITGLLDIGRYPAGTDARSRAIAADLGAATFSSFAVDHVQRWKYRKLLMNLGNIVEALCGRGGRSGELRSRLTAEGETVLAAAGLDVASAAEDRDRRGDLMQLGEIDGRTRGGGSTWQSFTRGTGDVETDYLNGEIVLLGRMHGIPTPANGLVQALARTAASERAAPGSIPADDILDQLDGDEPAGPRPG
jgi:2-dehydropantoate 2-reductase